MPQQFNDKSKYLYYSILVFFCVFVLKKINFFPVYIDEATTFLEYTSQGFLTTITSYQEPNNHVFFSIILVLFQKLPIDNLIAMRIPNLLISIFTIWTLYKYLQSKYNYTSTLIGTTIFTFCYGLIFYTIFARGYLLIILCCLLTYKNLDEIEKEYNIRNLIIIGITTIIGFFTIPVYLYVVVSFTIISLIRFWKNKKLLINLFFTACISGVTTLLLYTPIIYKNGINAIIKNEYNTPKSSSEILLFLKTSWIGFYDKIWGIQSGAIVGSLISYAIFLIFTSKKERKLGIEFILFVALPFLFVAIQKVIPGFRTWTYLIVPMILIITSLVEKISSNFNKKTISILTLILIFLCVVIQLYIFNKSTPLAGHQNDVEANKIATYLIKNHRFKSINFLDGRKDYDAVICLFESKRTKRKNHITFEPSSQNYSINIIEIKKYKPTPGDKLIKKFKNKLIYINNN